MLPTSVLVRFYKFRIRTVNHHRRLEWIIQQLQVAVCLPKTASDLNIIDSIKEQLSLLNLTEESFYGIGMGTPGKVDAENKTVIGAYNLNWSELQEVGKQFAEAFNLPFYIDSLADSAKKIKSVFGKNR